MTLAKLLKTLLPTLCIFYSFSRNSVGKRWVDRQAFGNGDYYLDLYFNVSPKGPFSNEKGRINFEGYFVTLNGQENIRGSLETSPGRRDYRFICSQGEFRGNLRRVAGRCESQLDFEIHGQKKVIGVLTAGFCS